MEELPFVLPDHKPEDAASSKSGQEYRQYLSNTVDVSTEELFSALPDHKPEDAVSSKSWQYTAIGLGLLPHPNLCLCILRILLVLPRLGSVVGGRATLAAAGMTADMAQQ